MTRQSSLETLEKSARELGHSIGSVIPNDVGFALLVYNFGKEGNMTYVSNGDREDMIKALKELIGRFEKEGKEKE